MARSASRGGIAVALKGEFEDVHGDASIPLVVEQQVGEAINLLLEPGELFAQLQQADGFRGRRGRRGDAGWRGLSRLGLLLPLAQHLEQLGHGHGMAEAGLDHGGGGVIPWH